jgi:glycosyltransferase involved in cell wall biosynthesis
MRKKILFAISGLGGGGAERVMILILRELDRTFWAPAVVVFEEGNDYLHEWPADVPIVCLNKRGRLSFFRLAWQLAAVLRQMRPALLFSFLTYTNYVAVLSRSLAATETPLLLGEHCLLAQALRAQRFFRLKERMVRSLYPKATAIIAVSEEIRRDLAANYAIPEDRCAVIYNPVALERVRELAACEADHPWFAEAAPVIAACGRLTAQKNYPLLLRAMRLVLDRIDARLIILGQGEQRASLERCARELGIRRNVDFLGFQENPFKYVARASALVLSSSWEGLPMVILEAMACGTPVISTRCPSGPEEIITDDLNGLLVPVGDEAALAEAILRVLADEPLRCRLAQAGRERAEDFRLERIVAQYEAMLREHAQGGPKVLEGAR